MKIESKRSQHAHAISCSGRRASEKAPSHVGSRQGDGSHCVPELDGFGLSLVCISGAKGDRFSSEIVILPEPLARFSTKRGAPSKLFWQPPNDWLVAIALQLCFERSSQFKPNNVFRMNRRCTDLTDLSLPFTISASLDITNGCG